MPTPVAPPDPPTTGEPALPGPGGPDAGAERADLRQVVTRYWDRDSVTYDRARGHVASSPAEQAAWSAALSRHLPSPPASVLDVGCGTGFLSLALARLGYRVTALDASEGMLAHLEASARRQGLQVDMVLGDAAQPPAGPFSAVVERHVLWTLPEPVAAMARWREAAPSGLLVLFESLWGASDRAEARRQRARDAWRRLHRIAPDHHAPYDNEVRRRLPFGDGTHPDRLVAAAEAAGWGAARLERLRDIEWARQLQRPPHERALGVTPVFAVIADLRWGTRRFAPPGAG